MDSVERDENAVFELDVALHPGEFINDYLEGHDWSQRDLSRRSGLTPKTISEICSGKAPVTPTTALALEKVFSRPARFWLGLQRRYDEAQARARAKATSRTWDDWTRKFPIKEMVKQPWFGIQGDKDPTESLLRFFGVSSPESWESVWNSYAVHYRQTRKHAASVEAISAWVRATELSASMIEAEPFDEKKLRQAFKQIRSLTRKKVEDAASGIQELCASAGVAVVWIPELPRTAISGCARWLSNSRALIGLSFRYRTDDQMWFTLFHEIGHLLMHCKGSSFILDNAVEGLDDKIVDPQMQKREEEANRFAADTLIPADELELFLESKQLTNDAIHKFAERIGIAPGVVVGRLQHEGILEYHEGNALKQTIHWHVADQGH